MTQQLQPPKHGVTVRAHVDGSLADALSTLQHVQLVMAGTRRIPPVRREEFRKLLAGVISECESVRLWLEAGCPEG